MLDLNRPVSSVRRAPLVSASTLTAVLLLPGCSKEGWEAPPPVGRQDGANVELVQELVDVMEERNLWALELEDRSEGVRVHLDRRAGGAGAPVYVQPQAAGAGAPAPNVSPAAAASGSTRSGSSGGRQTDEVEGGGIIGVADVFHPDNRPDANGDRPSAPAPRYGGRVIVHIPSLPKHTNYTTENSVYTRNFLYEVHETLLLQDWESHEFVPNVAKDWEVEDILVLKGGAEERYSAARELAVKPLGYEEPFDSFVLFGEIESTAGGYRVSPVTSGGSAASAPIEVADADVLAIERGAVMTFKLNNDVRWHPATGTANGASYAIDDQLLDANDVYFSWSVYANPEVECDEKRFQFEKVRDCEVIDQHTVRFFYQEQYFYALESIGVNLTLLPSHIFDLSDPDNPWFAPEASASQRARHINEHEHNRLWVGVGPYRITDWNDQYVEAVRFDEYFAPERTGYVDTIRWRYIQDDSSAFSALLNGELDYFERVKSAQYFGEATEQDEFKSEFYKGYKYLSTYGYTGWNSHRSYLSDKRVRQALAHAFPAEEYLRTNYKNLARRVTGPFPYSSGAYDHSIEPIPYDLEKARELLSEAGYYDTDGNGLVDKDGRDLVIEFLMPSGNDASKSLGLVLQENCGQIGIGIELANLEWATFLDRMKKREFDGVNLAWTAGLEDDPEQLWHSKWGQPGEESSNNSGIREPELDALILAGQREIDPEKRREIWHQIHRYLADWQPYLFAYNVPRKFAMSKRIRGFTTYAIPPGYQIREWYFSDASEPGTREEL